MGIQLLLRLLLQLYVVKCTTPSCQVLRLQRDPVQWTCQAKRSTTPMGNEDPWVQYEDDDDLWVMRTHG